MKWFGRLQSLTRSTRKSDMASESVHEEIGYKPASSFTRPVVDQGHFDYLTSWPIKMSRSEGLAKAREQLNRMEERDVGKASGSDTAQGPAREVAA